MRGAAIVVTAVAIRYIIASAMVPGLLDLAAMSKREPDCAQVLAQVEESLRAIKGHIVNYQLQLLLMRVGKKVEITYLPDDASKFSIPRNHGRGN
jgi:hypothetical protein